jgi:hypothetical protein
VRIEFTFSRDTEYFRCQLLPAALLRTRVLRFAAWVAVAVGAAIAAAYHERMAGPMVGAGLVLTGAVMLFARRRWIARLVTVPVSWHSPRRWLLTADGLESSTELTSAVHAWSTFRLGYVRDNAYLLMQDGPVVIDIPRLPLPTEQDTELKALLQERGILGPAAKG